MRRYRKLVRINVRIARNKWKEIGQEQLMQLRELSDRYGLSVALGDISYLNERIYVTHAGLLRLAQKQKCCGIRVCQVREFCDPVAGRWVFKATVHGTQGDKSFVGYGDADPTNTSPLVRGAEMRIAETRAVNRALRKAYGIGLCSVEELGCLTSRTEPLPGTSTVRPNSNGNGSGSGHTRLRDRLCHLIRQYQLDPTLVKRYAADFCGTHELRGASRDLVESFITHLAESAAQDRAALVCKLNSYAQPQEAHQ